MSDIVAIKAEGLGKRYLVGSGEGRHDSIRDLIVDKAKALVGVKRRRAAATREFWALRDASFEIRKGENVGIIGLNGAGKSTLLKILSRITEPTTGYADIQGRVAALLEVGTGFHPELSGRENIQLSGAILGMKRAEIMAQFDAIVEFAEIEKFIDTPAKHYSTGMFLRLAFAVAAHLNPEILLVDEVLAVGDASFQKKCLGRMNEVATQGRTVLFVSHNMAAVRTLCNRGVVLERGAVVHDGPIEDAIYSYFKTMETPQVGGTNRACELTDVRINGEPRCPVATGEPFCVSCLVNLTEELPAFSLLCVIQNINGEPVVVAPIEHRDVAQLNRAGTHRMYVQFPAMWMRPGVYNLHFRLQASTLAAGKAVFVSEQVMLDITGEVPSQMLIGQLTPKVDWDTESLTAGSNAARA
jgi:lipopolysaccharide transport system ATP-binding protein